MTNREKIAEMKVVDFFKNFVYSGCSFTAFITENMRCSKCPLENTCNGIIDPNCFKKIDKWLDKEVSE